MERSVAGHQVPALPAEAGSPAGRGGERDVFDAGAGTSIDLFHMRRFRKRSCRVEEYTPGGRHRFEHWYRDNTVYFITARCRDQFPAFESEEAKAVFWDRFDHWTSHYSFVPWIRTLMNNHYHALG